MTRPGWLRRVGLATLLASALCSTPASAIVAFDAAAATALTATFPGMFDGMARLAINRTTGGTLCSGSLLTGGQYLVTAAHCLTDNGTGALNTSNLAATFMAGVLNTATIPAANITIHPNWQGFTNSAGNGSDIALIRLPTAITTIAGYNLSQGNELGREFVMVGYGSTGVGATGSIGATRGSNQAPRYGRNVYDSTDDLLNTAMDARFQTSHYPVKYGETYLSDFDDGTANRNALARLHADLGGVLPFGSNTGLLVSNGYAANLEVQVAPGDSGGGDLVWDGSQWVLAAVHSYDWNACFYLTDCIPNVNGRDTFGWLTGSTAVFSHVGWISSVTGLALAVPEPGTVWFWLIGLMLVFLLKRRRGEPPPP